MLRKIYITNFKLWSFFQNMHFSGRKGKNNLCCSVFKKENKTKYFSHK